MRATQAEGHADSQRKLAEGSASEAHRQTAEARKAQGDALRAQGEAVQAKLEAEHQRNAVSQNLYYADMRLGLVDWNAGNIGRLSSKLFSHVPRVGGEDQRDWEWFYLLSLCHQDERTLMHHYRKVTSVTWSPDGRYVASTGQDTAARVYDANSGEPIRTWLREHSLGACWSPNSQWLAWGTTSSDSGVCVGNVNSGEVKSLRGHSLSVWTTAWSPDGRHLASAGMDDSIRIWDPAAGSCVRVIHGVRGYVYSLAWHPKGEMLASVHGRDGLTIWNAVSGVVLRTDPAISSDSIAWSPNGKQLALGTDDGKCALYKTADWSLLTEWQAHSGLVNWVAWNSGGARLASAGSDNLIQLWDVANGNRSVTIRGHLNQVLSVAWAPNGRRLVSGSMDGLVKVWPTLLPSLTRRLQRRPGTVSAIAWCEDGDAVRIFDASEGTVALWNVATGQALPKVPVTRGMSGQFSSGGRLLAIATTNERPWEILIHDARSGELIQTVKSAAVAAAFSAFSPDASKLAFSDASTLEVVDLRQHAFCFRRSDMVYLNKISWSPDGRLLAGAGHGETSDGGDVARNSWAYVFDAEKRERIMKVQHGASPVGGAKRGMESRRPAVGFRGLRWPRGGMGGTHGRQSCKCALPYCRGHGTGVVAYRAAGRFGKRGWHDLRVGPRPR